MAPDAAGSQESNSAAFGCAAEHAGVGAESALERSELYARHE